MQAAASDNASVAAEEQQVINFYSARHRFGEFSNFYEAPITLHGKVWPTSEHYFQAMKFPGTPHEGAIRRLTSPGQAAKAGRDRKKPLRADWEQVKEDVMLTAVRAKFTQQEELKQVLLSTGNAILVEHTTNDRYWGDGGDGTGRNALGKILMQVREEIRNETVPALGEDSKTSEALMKRPKIEGNGKLQEIEGDLLACPFTYIVHQCNCRSAKSKGLAHDLFADFPHANCYNGPAATTRRPGEIQICADGPRIVVNLFGQDRPGGPATKGHDSAQSRLHWFKQGLAAFREHLATMEGEPVTVAFPYNIGCGLAGGAWVDYHAALEEFAKSCPPSVEAVYILRLPSS